MSAPKKIYYDDFAGTVNREWMVGDTAYVREDLVDALVEAVEEVLRISDRKHDAWDRARAALAKLEESHD